MCFCSLACYVVALHAYTRLHAAINCLQLDVIVLTSELRLFLLTDQALIAACVHLICKLQ